MLGRTHIVASAAIAVDYVALSDLGTRYLQQTTIGIGWSVFTQLASTISLADPVAVCISAACLVVGSLLPDIDAPSSIVGRHLPFGLPFPHRTLTHSVWAVGIVVGLCWLLSQVVGLSAWWLLFGYISHLVMDSISAAGVCWLWPITNYKRFGSGAFINPHHKVKIYHAGGIGEYVVATILIAIAIGLGYLAWFA